MSEIKILDQFEAERFMEDENTIGHDSEDSVDLSTFNEITFEAAEILITIRRKWWKDIRISTLPICKK
jgi:hypothetical protein